MELSGGLEGRMKSEVSIQRNQFYKAEAIPPMGCDFVYNMDLMFGL